MRRWKKVALGLGAAALVGGGFLLVQKLKGGPLPAREPVTLVNAPQGWEGKQREFYYHTAQGTVFMPRSWFMAMKRPFGGGLADREWLAGLGFLTDGVEAGENNPDALPVGFSTFTFDGFDAVKQPQEMVGFTCSACHTGQLNYQGKGFRVDGGPAVADITSFSETVGLALLTNRYLPWRWSAFEKQVLGAQADDAQAQKALLAAYEPFLQGAKSAVWIGLKGSLGLGPKLYPTTEGFTRLDALGRIGNTVFADDLFEPANNRVGDAPVNFPHLWDISKFDWVQYNSSVRQPMVRNVGEALGVRAVTNFVNGSTGSSNPDPNNWDSSILVTKVHELEQTIAGLEAPRWPEELFGAIDREKAAEGRELFQKNCHACHGVRPVTGSAQADEIAVTTIPLDMIGTDPTAAVNFAKHRLDGSRLGVKEPLSPAEGLKLVTEKIKDAAYTKLGLTAEQRAEYDGYGRPNEVRAPCGYKARPLDGVWATPPFLHNGSVPTLYHLLSEKRPENFWLGTFEYDPKHLGYRWDKFKGGFELDTGVTGNFNTGHLFTDDESKPGRIGPALSEAQRWAILEYLKTMPDADLPPLPPVPADWGDDYPCKADPDWYAALKS